MGGRPARHVSGPFSSQKFQGEEGTSISTAEREKRKGEKRKVNCVAVSEGGEVCSLSSRKKGRKKKRKKTRLAEKEL